MGSLPKNIGLYPFYRILKNYKIHKSPYKKYLKEEDFPYNLFLIYRVFPFYVRLLLWVFFLILSFPLIFFFLLWGSKVSSSLGKVTLLYRLILSLFFSQKKILEEDQEIYSPRVSSRHFQKFLQEHTPEKYTGKLCYQFQEGEKSPFDKEAPEYLCIGSGPSVASFLKGLWERKPHASVWVLEKGDYFTQEEYFSQTPLQVVLQTYRDWGFSPIFHNPTNISVSLAPSVFGGGADIFSGTVMHPLREEEYLKKMEFSPQEYRTYYRQIAKECHIGRKKYSLINRPQQLFLEGAKKKGYPSFLLEKFGTHLDEGWGREYAGIKGRIPYMEEFLRDPKKNLLAFANVKVERLLVEKGKIYAIEVSLLDRKSRKPITREKISLSPHTKVILGAGSLGNYELLSKSGFSKLHGTPGVKHQLTVEILGLFEEEMPANGEQQAIGVRLFPKDSPLEDILIEGAQPERGVLTGVGAPPVKNPVLLREKQKYIGCIGVMITEKFHGKHKRFSSWVFTQEKLDKEDKAKLLIGIEKAIEIWKEAGAIGCALNLPRVFPSKDRKLREIGFFRPEEVNEVIYFTRKAFPQIQTFYRTGHLYSVVDTRTGKHPEVENLYVVSEDSLPPGPGGNPTLPLMIQARRKGHLL